jgi:hypothetical protein
MRAHRAARAAPWPPVRELHCASFPVVRGQLVVGFGGGPHGLAVVARNRVLVGELGRIGKGRRALFRAGNGERGGDSPAHGSSDGDLAQEGGRGVR